MDKKKLTDFGFYAILTNPVRGYEYCTKVLVEHEIPFVQLRMKEEHEFTVLKMAEKMRIITENTQTRLIINDHPCVTVDAGADGVHVGQDDMAIEEVRAIVNKTSIVGLSTHSPQQTEEACKKDPDYIGIGPVYATPSKKIPDPVIGIDGMKQMLEKSTVPAVCIGGISLERLPEVLAAGARNVSLVRALCDSSEPAKIVKKIQAIFKNTEMG